MLRFKLALVPDPFNVTVHESARRNFVCTLFTQLLKVKPKQRSNFQVKHCCRECVFRRSEFNYHNAAACRRLDCSFRYRFCSEFSKTLQRFHQILNPCDTTSFFLFAGDIGGTLGLYLGGSILTLVELLDIFILVVVQGGKS